MPRHRPSSAGCGAARAEKISNCNVLLYFRAMVRGLMAIERAWVQSSKVLLYFIAMVRALMARNIDRIMVEPQELYIYQRRFSTLNKVPSSEI